MLSCVYAAKLYIDRVVLWSNLQSLKGCMDSFPWLLVEDFNIILTSEEHSNEGYTLSTAEKDFSNCLRSIKVEDCTFSGSFFTWSNRQLEGYIAKKLDMTIWLIAILWRNFQLLILNFFSWVF